MEVGEERENQELYPDMPIKVCKTRDKFDFLHKSSRVIVVHKWCVLKMAKSPQLLGESGSPMAQEI